MASGDPGASWGLRLRARDLAKIGQSILDNGFWHGRQIVSADWINEMSLPRVVTSKFSLCLFLVARPVIHGWPQHRVDQRPRLGRTVPQYRSEARSGPRSDAGVYDFEGKGPQNPACDTGYGDECPAGRIGLLTIPDVSVGLDFVEKICIGSSWSQLLVSPTANEESANNPSVPPIQPVQ
jgi:hypothetical protein